MIAQSLSLSKLGKLVLLTGASGFIGTRVQNLLVDRKYRVRLLTRKLDMALPSIGFTVGDLTVPSDCQQAMHKVDIVIHIAGEKRDASRFWPVNVQGTKNLLAAAMEKGVERFVHLSSVGVIGADPLQQKVYHEDVPCMPRNQYERSKWEAEKLVHQAATKGFPVAILRPANVFGDGDPEKGLLRLMRNVRNGWFVYLGGRNAICNYIFVEDVAYACLSLAEHPNAIGRTFHLSDDCTLGEFVERVSDELGVKRSRLELPRPLPDRIRTVLRVMRRLPGFSQSSLALRLISLNNQARFDTTRLAEELEFRCPVGWRAGLNRVVRWYRSQGEI